jgi:hypothetical protein
MISPEVQGALIGVGAMFGAWFMRVVVFYFKNKINGQPIRVSICSQHQMLVDAIDKINEYYEDEKHIRLYMEAIKRVKAEALIPQE